MSFAEGSVTAAFSLCSSNDLLGLDLLAEPSQPAEAAPAAATAASSWGGNLPVLEYNSRIPPFTISPSLLICLALYIYLGAIARKS